MTDPMRHIGTLFTATWKLILVGLTVGAAWRDLHAEIRENKLLADARFAVMASDIHVLKVLACKSYPHDSECSITP